MDHKLPSRSRRRFLQTLAVSAAGVLLLPKSLAMAEGDPWTLVSVSLDTLDKIKVVGSSMALELQGTPVILVRTATDKIAAFSPICSHEKCMVTYGEAEKRFHCKCHSSDFDETGKPLFGPATANLTRYATGIKDGNLVVRLPK